MLKEPPGDWWGCFRGWQHVPQQRTRRCRELVGIRVAAASAILLGLLGRALGTDVPPLACLLRATTRRGSAGHFESLVVEEEWQKASPELGEDLLRNWRVLPKHEVKVPGNRSRFRG